MWVVLLSTLPFIFLSCLTHSLSLLLLSSLYKQLILFSLFFCLYLLLFPFLGLSDYLRNLSLLSSHLSLTSINSFLLLRLLIELHACQLALQLLNDIIISVKVYLLSQLWLLLDILHEQLHVFVYLRTLLFVLLVSRCLWLFVKLTQFPKAMLLVLSEARESLTDYYHMWHCTFNALASIDPIINLLYFLKVNSIKIVTKDCIIVVKHFSQMSINNKCLVITTKIYGPSHLDLHHLKPLCLGSSGNVSIVIIC